MILYLLVRGTAVELFLSSLVGQKGPPVSLQLCWEIKSRLFLRGISNMNAFELSGHPQIVVLPSSSGAQINNLLPIYYAVVYVCVL